MVNAEGILHQEDLLLVLEEFLEGTDIPVEKQCAHSFQFTGIPDYFVPHSDFECPESGGSLDAAA